MKVVLLLSAAAIGSLSAIFIVVHFVLNYESADTKLSISFDLEWKTLGSANSLSTPSGNQLITETSSQDEMLNELVTMAPCPSVPILTSFDDGRLGNKMWEYASLWTLSKEMGRPGYAPHSMLSNLSKVFSNLQLLDFDDISHCDLSFNKEPLSSEKFDSVPEAIENYQNRHVRLKKDITLTSLVMSSLNELQEHFRFHRDIVRQVDNTIAEFNGTGRIIVGVHVQRTDYKNLQAVKWYDDIAKEYYLYAIEWYRKKSNKPLLFMIVSDDVEWCKANLLNSGDDVVIASKSAAHNMALLATSNHTIINQGSFGQWGAILSALRGGHMIVYNAAKSVNEIIAKRLKNVHFYEPRLIKIA